MLPQAENDVACMGRRELDPLSLVPFHGDLLEGEAVGRVALHDRLLRLLFCGRIHTLREQLLRLFTGEPRVSKGNVGILSDDQRLLLPLETVPHAP